MLVLSSHREIAQAGGRLPSPRVVVIGNFDGVHRGHKALLQRARQILYEPASATGTGSVVVLSFRPHPAQVLAPHLAPPLLSSWERKRELLANEGVDALVEEPFDRAFSLLSPEEFVEQILLAPTGLLASAVVVGYDFTFGKGRAGSTARLTELLSQKGARASVVPAVTVPDPDDGTALRCSSTLVRQALRAGQPERAALLLGHEPELEGEVVHGAGRGRQIGVPTANLRCTSEVLPALGVYAAWAELLYDSPALPSHPALAGDPPASLPAAAPASVIEVKPRLVQLRCPAAVNVGYNPTFTSGRGDSPMSPVSQTSAAPSPISVEAHLLNRLDAPPLPSLYGRTLRLRLVSRIRAEQKFPSVAALVEQIGRDVDTVARRLGVER
jgi:riboflavin kinase/FMN adenylyltransferase